jgi:hypothetical protein
MALLRLISPQWHKDSLACAHEWPSICVGNLLRQLDEAACRPYTVRRKGSLIEIVEAVCAFVLTMPGVARNALLALSTAILDVSESNSISTRIERLAC